MWFLKILSSSLTWPFRVGRRNIISPIGQCPRLKGRPPRTAKNKQRTNPFPAKDAFRPPPSPTLPQALHLSFARRKTTKSHKVLFLNRQAVPPERDRHGVLNASSPSTLHQNPPGGRDCRQPDDTVPYSSEKYVKQKEQCFTAEKKRWIGKEERQGPSVAGEGSRPEWCLGENGRGITLTQFAINQPQPRNHLER